MYKEQKTNVKFKDADNNLFKVEIEITHRNGYPEFSMSGEGKGGLGQCDDSIKPKNPKQKRLLELWNTYHLNGMNAGTPKQTELIKEMEKTTTYSYEKAKEYLDSFGKDGKPITAFELAEIKEERKNIEKKIKKVVEEIDLLKDTKINLGRANNNSGYWIVIKELDIKQFFNTDLQKNNYFKKEIGNREKKLEDLKKILEQEQEKTMLYDRDKKGVLYEYGSTWHKVDLPENLWEEVEQLVKEISEIEELSRTKGGDWDDITDYKIVALGKYLELEPKEAEEDITEEYDGVYSYCGVEYYVLTEEEAWDKAEDYLGDELWQMAVEGDTIYSYGYHFPIAKRKKWGYLFNSNGYSHSTEKHKGYVNNSLNGIVIHIENCDLSNATKQINQNKEEIKELEQKIQRARKDYIKESYKEKIKWFNEQIQLIRKYRYRK